MTGCALDTDGDGNCPVHPDGCFPAPQATTFTRTDDGDFRKGDWLCTASGRQFYPEDIRLGDFDIEDIAHGLSNLCRFAGHTRSFYSVAQHSCYVSDFCPGGFKLWGLLHDATEAYLVDLPRPVKFAVGSAYTDLEHRCMEVIALQFGLRTGALREPIPGHIPGIVKQYDEAVLAAEARDLMPPASVAKWRLRAEPPAGLARIEPWQPSYARTQFLERFRHLFPRESRFR